MTATKERILSPSEKAALFEKVAGMLAHIPNKIKREAYYEPIAKRLKVAKKDFTDEVAKILDAKAKEKQKAEKKGIELHLDDGDGRYVLPMELQGKLKFTDIADHVYEWDFFTFQNVMYFSRRVEGGTGFYFVPCSNFSIRVIQHMEDEKYPKKLIQVMNTKGRKRTFETLSENTTTLNQFKKMVEGWGNFHFTGTQTDYEKLKGKLLNDMGDGRMITELGWQSEGFWVFNNGIYNSTFHALDENGCIEYGEPEPVSYYIPSGNKLYSGNKTKYVNQKLCRFIEPKITIDQWIKQLHTVHGRNGMAGVCFAIACVFSDVIFDHLKAFPLLFFYGEASTGKTQLINAMMSLFGYPQPYITITGKANTDKAKIRKFAQFINQLVCLEEYRRSVSDDVNEMLKALYNRMGYERGNIDSAYGTEAVPVQSAVVITSNDYPTYDSLVTRLVILEFDKSEFTEAEREEYDKLLVWIKQGYSGLLGEFVKHRKMVEEKFTACFREANAEMYALMMGIECPTRMIENPAVILAMYKLFKTQFTWSFTEADLKTYLADSMIRQNEKRDTSGDVQHWWDCFLHNVKEGELRNEYEFHIDGDVLTVRVKECHLKYLTAHYQLFRASGHSFSTMTDKLTKSPAFVKHTDSHRYGKVRSSGLQFSIQKINIAMLDVMEELQAKTEEAKEKAEAFKAKRAAEIREVTDRIAEEKGPEKKDEKPETTKKDDELPF